MWTKPSLAECDARLTEARLHRDRLNDACIKIIESDGFGFDADCDQHGFGEIRFVDNVDDALLLMASTLFGEFISNLWVARNYLIWQLASLREGVEQPQNWKRSAFPVMSIEPSPTETFAGRARGQLDGLDAADYAKIEAVQPYQTGNPDPVSGLRRADTSAPHYILEELAVLDRHRRLVLLPLFPLGFNFNVNVVQGQGHLLHVTPDQSKIDKPLKGGDVVGTFRVRFVTHCSVKVQPNARVQIFPGDVVPLNGFTFETWLNRLDECVSDLVDQFRSEFP